MSSVCWRVGGEEVVAFAKPAASTAWAMSKMLKPSGMVRAMV